MILRYVNLYFFDGKTGVLTKTRKGEKQLSPFGGSNDREYLGILCAKVLLDLFYIFADFMECLAAQQVLLRFNSIRTWRPFSSLAYRSMKLFVPCSPGIYCSF